MHKWVGVLGVALGVVSGCGGRVLDDRGAPPANGSAGAFALFTSGGAPNGSAGAPSAAACPICANPSLLCVTQPESQTLVRGDWIGAQCSFGNGIMTLLIDCQANSACAPDNHCDSLSTDQLAVLGTGYICFGG